MRLDDNILLLDHQALIIKRGTIDLCTMEEGGELGMNGYSSPIFCNDARTGWTIQKWLLFTSHLDAFIHNVCSPQAITSPWGTLQTPNFPNPYTSSDDCWCKLSTQLQHRLLLSIIVFQLIPYDRSYSMFSTKKNEWTTLSLSLLLSF